jgi:rubrerythrin
MDKPSSDIGLNRTGLGASPIDGPRMVSAAADNPPGTVGDAAALHAACAPYVVDAPSIGSVPPPAALRGVVEAAVKAVQLEKTAVFLDALGERIAFERTGIRLYDALLTKIRALGDPLPMYDIEVIRDEEHRHLRMLQDEVRRLGADPTAVTPSAEIAATASAGILTVVSDPRSTVAQTLYALLMTELADRAGWELAIRLARQRGDERLVREFGVALADEQIHVNRVRGWHEERVLAEARFAPPLAH